MIMRCISDYANFALCRKRGYHVINFPICSFLSFFGRKAPILIVIAVQMPCNNTSPLLCHCCFMMTSVQSLPHDTWHSYATTVRVFIMCVLHDDVSGNERKLYLVSLYALILQRVYTYVTHRRRIAFIVTFDELTVATLSLTARSCGIVYLFWALLRAFQSFYSQPHAHHARHI